MIIPENFFDEPRRNVFIELPYCLKNEDVSKEFIAEFKTFTNHELDVVIKWNTRKVKSLFKLKSGNPHPACKIYHGKCSCGETYIGETMRKIVV